MQTRASQAPGNEAFTLAKRQLSANFTSARQKWSISSCHPDPRYHGLCHFPTAALLLPRALFTLHCAATTHVLPHSKTMWQIHKSVYVSECWKRAQILLAARPTLLLSSEWGLQCSSVPQTWTLPRLFLLWPWATDLRVCPWWPRCEGTEILAGSSPRHVLPFILAHEEALHTGREAKQKGTARPAYCKVVKLVLEFWALKIIWVVWRGVGRGRSSYLPARISSLASWGYVSKFFSSAAGTRK